MKIVARQWRWITVLRIAIGCGVVAAGLLLPWTAVQPNMQENDWRVLRFLIGGGLVLAPVGGYFAYYARMEWRPRGFALGICRHGLVCKVNNIACPRLLVIKWPSICNATHDRPRWFGLISGSVRLTLQRGVVLGVLPEFRGDVRMSGPNAIRLGGWWEAWHPADVADLVNAAITDPAVRESLSVQPH